MKYKEILDSIESKPYAYYHFLDGYLNPNKGSIINYNFLQELLSINLLNDIHILSTYYDKSSKINMNFINNNTEDRYIINIDNITDELFTTLLYKFKFCIYPISNKTHSMSIIINMTKITDNYNTNILLINSGDGIHNHDKILIDDINYYKPYYGFNFQDIANKSIEKILIIIFFMILYHRTTNFPNQEYSYDEFIPFNNIISKIYNIFKLSDINMLQVIIIHNYNTIMTCKPLLNIIEFNKLQQNLSPNYKYKFNIDNSISLLYKLFTILNSIKSYNLNINNKINFDMNIIKREINKIIPNSDLNENVILKNKFHIINSNIYILEQINGSCTWYSIFWSLSIYIIINKINDYQQFNINIYNFFVKQINDTFNNIKFNLQDDLSSFYTLKNIQFKLINIKLLSNIYEKYNIIDNITDLRKNVIKSNYNLIKDFPKSLSIDYIYSCIFKFNNYYLYEIIQYIYNYLNNNNYNINIFNNLDYIKLNVNKFFDTINIDIYIKEKYKFEINNIIKTIESLNNNDTFIDSSICKYYYICRYILYENNIDDNIKLAKFIKFSSIIINLGFFIKNERLKTLNINEMIENELPHYIFIESIKIDFSNYNYSNRILYHLNDCINNIDFVNGDYERLPYIVSSENINIINLNNINNFILNNPSYIKNDENLFILLNKNIIFSNSNGKLRDNLIKYYCNLFVKNIKHFERDSKVTDTNNILFNLQILINKYLPRNIENISDKLYYVHYYQKYMSDISFEQLYNKLKELSHNEKFIDNVISMKNILFDNNNLILYYINLYNLNLSDNYKIYKLNLFKNIFNNDIVLSHNNDLYIFYDDFYLLIKIITDKYLLKFKINEILYNGNIKIISYEDINDPFKYFIPNNCINIIYKINNIWHITFFINKIENSTLLGEFKINNKTITIKINKNNFFPINSDINKLILIYEHYGYNDFGKIFINKKCDYGIYINDYEYNLIKKEFNFLKDKCVNCKRDTLISIPKYFEIDNSLNNTIKSLKKLKYKFINCNINQQKINKYKSLIESYKIKCISFITNFTKLIKNYNWNKLINNYNLINNYIIYRGVHLWFIQLIFL